MAREAWTDDPYSGRVKEGKIYGRGIADMKGGVTASIFAFIYLAKIREKMKGKVTLTLVSDEETLGEWGARYLIEHHPEVLGDVLLNGEPDGKGNIVCGGKGMLMVEITCKGLSAHGAYTGQRGRNAIEKMCGVISKLKALEDYRPEIPQEVQEIVSSGREVLEREKGKGAVEVLTKITVNIGTIKGGTKVNLIPDRCDIEADIRIPHGVVTQFILEQFEELFSHDEAVRYKITYRGEPNYSSPKHLIFQLLDKNIREIQETTPAFNVHLACDDARLWRWRGIPAAVYGPNGFNVGAANEYIYIDELIGVTKVHALSSFDFLGWKK